MNNNVHHAQPVPLTLSPRLIAGCRKEPCVVTACLASDFQSEYVLQLFKLPNLHNMSHSNQNRRLVLMHKIVVLFKQYDIGILTRVVCISEPPHPSVCQCWYLLLLHLQQSFVVVLSQLCVSFMAVKWAKTVLPPSGQMTQCKKKLRCMCELSIQTMHGYKKMFYVCLPYYVL